METDATREEENLLGEAISSSVKGTEREAQDDLEATKTKQGHSEVTEEEASKPGAEAETKKTDLSTTPETESEPKVTNEPSPRPLPPLPHQQPVRIVELGTAVATSKPPPSLQQPRPSPTGGTPCQDYVTLSQQKLTGLFLSGEYVDRIWVEAVSGYRDRIVIDSEETAVLKAVKSVQRKGRKAIADFVGIQKNETELSLLTNWRDLAPPFGHYWFLVDRVLFHKSGFDLAVRVLRSKEEAADNNNTKVCPKCHHRLDQSTNQENDTSLLAMSADLAMSWRQQFTELMAPKVWWAKVGPYLTWENLVQSVKFGLLLCLAAATGLVTFIQNLLPMLNKTLLALGTVIHKATPVMLACLDTVNKVIGATFLMINRFWADLYHGPRPTAAPPAAAALRHQPQRPAIDLPGTRYWARQNVSDRDNNRDRLGLEGPTSRYPYLRSDIKRPYL